MREKISAHATRNTHHRFYAPFLSAAGKLPEKLAAAGRTRGAFRAACSPVETRRKRHRPPRRGRGTSLRRGKCREGFTHTRGSGKKIHACPALPHHAARRGAERKNHRGHHPESRRTGRATHRAVAD